MLLNSFSKKENRKKDCREKHKDHDRLETQSVRGNVSRSSFSNTHACRNEEEAVEGPSDEQNLHASRACSLKKTYEITADTREVDN